MRLTLPQVAGAAGPRFCVVQSCRHVIRDGGVSRLASTLVVHQERRLEEGVVAVSALDSEKARVNQWRLNSLAAE